MAVEDMRTQLGVGGKAHGSALESFASVFIEAQKLGMPFRDALDAYLGSQWCIVERGLGKLVALDGKRPVIFAPETHHYCFDKAADVLGLGRENIVRVPVDSEFRMDVAKLAEFLDDPGIRPIAVVSVVGTTEEGAVDPVDQVAALRTHRRAEGKDGFWHHVDGAYGAYLRTMTRPQRLGLGDPWTTVRINGEDQQLPLVLPEQHTCDALEALSESDSVTIDPHKLGYVPYPAGAICFKSDLVKPLTRQEAPYIGDPAGSPEEERQSEGIGLYALEGSKPGAAAAAVWLSHSLIPLDSTGHGQLVRDTVRNACELHALLEQWPLWNPRRTVRAVPLTNPGSNIVCFAFRPVGSGSLASLNALNQAIYEAFSLNEGSERRVYEQEFFVSRTTLRPEQYSVATVKPFLARLGVVDQEYMTEGVRLLRCVLMNPWYEQAKAKGRWFLTEMVESLYTQAESLLTA
jgi:glutamate/tyrosine decarboxylase-like PLP-dependent enzyme